MTKEEVGLILLPKEIQLIEILKERILSCPTNEMPFTTLKKSWLQKGFALEYLDQAIEKLFGLQMIDYDGRKATDYLFIVSLKYEEPIKLSVSGLARPYIIVVSCTWKDIVEKCLREAKIPIACIRQHIVPKNDPSEYIIDIANGVAFADVQAVVEKCYEYGLCEYKEERKNEGK